jgi:hypothetical protein
LSGQLEEETSRRLQAEDMAGDCHDEDSSPEVRLSAMCEADVSVVNAIRGQSLAGVRSLLDEHCHELSVKNALLCWLKERIEVLEWDKKGCQDWTGAAERGGKGVSRERDVWRAGLCEMRE